MRSYYTAEAAQLEVRELGTVYYVMLKFGRGNQSEIASGLENIGG